MLNLSIAIFLISSNPCEVKTENLQLFLKPTKLLAQHQKVAIYSESWLDTSI